MAAFNINVILSVSEESRRIEPKFHEILRSLRSLRMTAASPLFLTGVRGQSPCHKGGAKRVFLLCDTFFFLRMQFKKKKVSKKKRFVFGTAANAAFLH